MAELAQGSIAAAVVKDDAYGLGADKVASLLYEKAKCRHFFVAHAIEGKKISSLVPEAVIYVLQGIGSDSLPLFQQTDNLVPVINSPEMLKFWQIVSIMLKQVHTEQL